MGKRPLYQEHGHDTFFQEFQPIDGHVGLWYDKFCDQWDWMTDERSEIDVSTFNLEKMDWMTKLPRTVPQDEGKLKESAQRRQAMIQNLCGQVFTLWADSPFVTGLGREHPVENGFVWHQSLGTPYLPGSSLKGAIHAWVKEWYNPKPNTDLITRVFGASSGEQDISNGKSKVGNVVFFDALPAKKVQLRFDVMTPHYVEYYQEGKEPGDWLNPVPIPFLTVAQGAEFQFGLAPVSKKDSQACEDCKMVKEEWLVPALEWMGIGAKTAVGYGRFREQ